MIKRIVIDGNDGTGKTTRLEKMKEIFPNIEFRDRGVFSEMTLVDMLFTQFEKYDYASYEAYKKKEEFCKTIREDKDTLYIICRASAEVCQERIKMRGDSIEDEYHTMEDLVKYGKRFDVLIGMVDDLPNVMVVDTDKISNVKKGNSCIRI
jgi:deoxyadenosine/deoxycytidine kinase